MDLSALPLNIARKFSYLIFNYEALIVSAKTYKKVPPLFELVTHHILDEAHYFRNALSRRFMAYLHFVTQNPPQALTVLTGTPIDRSIVELWPYFILMSKNPLGSQIFEKYFGNFSVFSARYLSLIHI